MSKEVTSSERERIASIIYRGGLRPGRYSWRNCLRLAEQIQEKVEMDTNPRKDALIKLMRKCWCNGCGKKMVKDDWMYVRLDEKVVKRYCTKSCFLISLEIIEVSQRKEGFRDVTPIGEKTI
jgi:hypothetical protein